MGRIIHCDHLTKSHILADIFIFFCRDLGIVTFLTLCQYISRAEKIFPPTVTYVRGVM